MNILKTLFSLLIVVALLFSLCSCALFLPRITNTKKQSDDDSTYIDDSFKEQEESSQDESSQDEPSDESSIVQKPVNQANVLETEYFYVTIPNSWNNNYHVEMYTGTDPNTNGFMYTVSFAEKIDYERFGGGHLVDIIITPDKEFNSFASGEIIGEITLEKTYYLFARYPSDVQFDFDNQQLYTSMQNDIRKVLASITAKSQNSPIKLY